MRQLSLYVSSTWLVNLNSFPQILLSLFLYPKWHYTPFLLHNTCTSWLFPLRNYTTLVRKQVVCNIRVSGLLDRYCTCKLKWPISYAPQVRCRFVVVDLSYVSLMPDMPFPDMCLIGEDHWSYSGWSAGFPSDFCFSCFSRDFTCGIGLCSCVCGLSFQLV